MSIEREALWTAYALGELEGPQREALERELEQSAEIQAWIEEVQEMASLLEAELQLPAQDQELKLTEQQKAALEGEVSGAGGRFAETAAVSTPRGSAQPAVGEPDPHEPDDPIELPGSGASWKWGIFASACLVLLVVAGGGSTFMLYTAQSPKRSMSYMPQKPMSAPARRSSRYRKPRSKARRSRRSRRARNLALAPLPSGPPAKTPAILPSADKNQASSGDGRGLHDRKGKGGKKDEGKKKSQVWQRTQSNTVLSKVSVGGKKYLVLKKMRVTVSIEGLRARTVIDHIYYNPHHRTLQGTFKYTLPARASVSYYAMFVGRSQVRAPRFFGGKIPRRQLVQLTPAAMVRKAPSRDWGKLREARLVAAEKGRQVYEEITRRRIDPALLEQDAPNTFTGRVFPIPSRGYNRVIIAYEQTLPQLGDRLVYRFRFPQQVAESIDFSIEYDDKLASLKRSNLRKIRCRAPQSASFLRCYWEQNKPDRDAVFYFASTQKGVQWTAGTDPVENRRYLMARIRAKLPASTKRFGAEQALFAIDTSLSANPDLFAAHFKLLKEILRRNQGRIKRFNILFFDVGSLWADPRRWIPNTRAERRKLFAKVYKLVLEGATNFESALRALARPSWKVKANSAVDIFVLSDGQVNWGETQLELALARFKKQKRFGQIRIFTYQMGLGSENSTFLMRLAREGGALFSCLGRAEIPRCAVAHTKPAMLLQKVEIQGIGATETLVEGRQVSLYPNALVSIASRYRRNGAATLWLKGSYMGKAIALKHQIQVRTNGDLAPRAWAEMAVHQLSELHSPKLTPLIVAYSQHFRIPNEHASFLVLETDKEYKQYGLDKWRKAKRVVDLSSFIDKWLKRFGAAVSTKARWHAIFRKGAKRAKILRHSSGRMIFSILRRLPDSAFQFREIPARRFWTQKRVAWSYLKSRLRDKNDFDPFVKEARRRLSGDVNGAVRALSSIVELHPSNPQALRLVGYYLMSWQRPAEAAQVFLKVLERRSFEPHSYRDLARALLKLQRYALAAALYEIVLAGKWHRRFGAIATIAREEYALLLQEAHKSGSMRPSMRYLLRRRRALLGLYVKRSKLRVTVTWNTDNTDIDLWVTGPTGEKCYYGRRRTRNGGHLLQDITRGYGPERYENVRGRNGNYKIQLHFYGNSSNVLGNETHASVVIVLHAGTKKQRTIVKNLVLKRGRQVVDVAQIKLGGKAPLPEPL